MLKQYKNTTANSCQPLFLSFDGVDGSRIIDYFFGSSNSKTKDLDEAGQNLEDYVENYYNQHVGFRSVSKEEVREQGLQYAAAKITVDDNDWLKKVVVFL